MITGELKNKIDSLGDIFAAGGLSNPLDVIEQMTYLMFIHDFPAAKMYSNMQENVFSFIKNLHGNKESAYSKATIPKKLDETQLLLDSLMQKYFG